LTGEVYGKEIKRKYEKVGEMEEKRVIEGEERERSGHMSVALLVPGAALVTDLTRAV
jgi:hypothetical protein